MGISAFGLVAEIQVEPGARVYESGWQSWSASTSYDVLDAPHRPRPQSEVMNGWGNRPAPPLSGFQGEGLLAVDPGGGQPVVVIAASDPTTEVATVRAGLSGGVLEIRANGPVDVVTHPVGTALPEALASWADGLAGVQGLGPLRPAPTLWCSWYHYFTAVTEDHVRENLEAIQTAGLPLEVIQIDDGYQAEIGDWLELSDRFHDLAGLASQIRSTGRSAGIWVAPFLVAEHSHVVRDHPDWLVGGLHRPVGAGHNWGQEVFALDLSHPAVRDHLTTVFSTFRDMGFDLFKLDFLYGGALEGSRSADVGSVECYRSGLALIRDAVGQSSYLLGCGAPILPSVGLVDAMRVSPDTGPEFDPPEGDLTAPCGLSSIVTGRGRAWQQGRWWVNDADCLLTDRNVERRETLADHVAHFSGMVGVSGSMLDLDAWGDATIRTLVEHRPGPYPFSALPDGAEAAS